jgi:hypothetical protein
MSWHGSFSSYCFVDVCTILKGVIHVIKRFMASGWSFLQKESSCPSCVAHFHPSWEDSLSICFRQYLVLRKVGEYNHTARTLQPMTLATPLDPLEDTVVAFHQLHPLPLDLVPPPIFDYQLEHIFVLDKILFAQTLTIAPHLFSGGLSGMVYEHFLGCFILEDPSSRFLELF